MLKGFREFIVRGNVIDLAVAVVIGAAFTAIVNVLVNEVINPLIGAVFQANSLDDALTVTIPTLNADEPAELRFGAVIGAAITFVIVAAVVYFVFVLPVNRLKERAEAKRKAGVIEEDAPVTELDLLTEIRDLLATDAASRGSGSAGTGPRH